MPFADLFCYILPIFIFGLLPRLFLVALQTPAGRRLTSKLSCVVSIYECVTVNTTYPYTLIKDILIDLIRVPFKQPNLICQQKYVIY